MRYLIEIFVELLFSSAKKQPQERPEIEFKEKFTVFYDKTICKIELLIMFFMSALLYILSIFVDNDTRILFLIIAAMLSLSFFLFLVLFSFRYDVTVLTIKRRILFLFNKEILWDDIICLRTIERDDFSEVIIALYTNDNKCVMDVSSDLENAWYVVKMAEFKNIEIRNEKNLSIKQIRKL